jgi:hypothetical protein
LNQGSEWEEIFCVGPFDGIHRQIYKERLKKEKRNKVGLLAVLGEGSSQGG